MDPHADSRPSAAALAMEFVSAIYGGYFGAGLSIVYIAVLGLLLDDRLVRLNALKQALSFITIIVAAVFFVGSGKVVWSLAAVMVPTSLIGGFIGGRLVGLVPAKLLRAAVIMSGLAITVKLFLTDRRPLARRSAA